MRNFITSLPGAITLTGILVLIVWRLALTLPDLPSRFPPFAPDAPPVVLATQIVITMIVLISSLYVVLSRRYPSDTEKWAFGTIGLLIGYWMPAAC